MKDVLHEALLMAQKSADDRVKSAREQANKIIADAKEQADAMCREAASEAERLRAGVEQIRNIRDMYAQEFRGILAKFDNQLNQAMNSQLGGAVDSVLEVREKTRGRASARGRGRAADQIRAGRLRRGVRDARRRPAGDTEIAAAPPWMRDSRSRSPS